MAFLYTAHAVMKPTWTPAQKAPADFFVGLGDVPSLTAQLLWNRGVRDAQDARKFLHPSLERDVHDPFLFTDMQRAVERIMRAMANNERIAIWGDYDCDGVCGTTILYTFFRAMGYEQYVNVHIPDRNKEGYGLSMVHLEEIAAEGVKILITVDCGITDKTEIAWAREHSIDVIIADHHSVPETLPHAYAILNPKDPRSGYPFPGLAGTGVAFKLASALLSSLNPQQATSYKLQATSFLDLVALATLADTMPLRNENRILVREGFAQLAHTSLPGLKALLAFCGLAERFTVRDLHFGVIPLLNAMGRMEHASVSFRLLAATDADEVSALVRHLDEKNRERQLVVDVIEQEVLERIGRYEKKPSLVFESSPTWVPGVLGLAAQRVMNEVGRPVVLAIENPETHLVVGNARALGAFNIVEALHAHSELFSDAGGHPHAGGFNSTGEKLPQVRAMLLAAGERVEREGGYAAEDAVVIDAELQWNDITWQTYEAVQQAWPFGEENQEPQFLFKNLTVVTVKAVGGGARHLKLTFGSTGNQKPKTISAIAFGFGAKTAAYPPGSMVDVVVKLSENRWNGKRTLELDVVDMDIVSS